MLTLKAKDSESSENEPIIETDIFQSDADPSDSPYSQEYFDLMDMIDIIKWYILPRSMVWQKGGTA